MKDKIIALLSEPRYMVRFHGAMTLIWVGLIVPSLLWWSESILWVILMSVWANIAGHWASFQAASGEHRIELDDDVHDAVLEIAELRTEIRELCERLGERPAN